MYVLIMFQVHVQNIESIWIVTGFCTGRPIVNGEKCQGYAVIAGDTTDQYCQVRCDIGRYHRVILPGKRVYCLTFVPQR